MCETAGIGGGARSELRALAFSVFTGARRLLAHAPAGKSLTGFGTAAQAHLLLDAMDVSADYWEIRRTKFVTCRLTLALAGRQDTSRSPVQNGCLLTVLSDSCIEHQCRESLENVHGTAERAV